MDDQAVNEAQEDAVVPDEYLKWGFQDDYREEYEEEVYEGDEQHHHKNSPHPDVTTVLTMEELVSSSPRSLEGPRDEVVGDSNFVLMNFVREQQQMIQVSRERPANPLAYQILLIKYHCMAYDGVAATPSRKHYADVQMQRRAENTGMQY